MGMGGTVGVDVGFGFTKAVLPDGRSVSFPSVAVPVPGRGELAGTVGGGQVRHLVRVQRDGGGDGERLMLVGDAGLAAGGTRTWDAGGDRRDYAVLVLTAAALLGAAGGAIDLAVGLPLSAFLQPDARRALRDRLQGVGAWVSMDGADAARVDVRGVRVYPQAAGAYFAAMMADPELAGQRVGVLDVGYRTTDYLMMIPTGAGGVMPDESRSGTVDAGIGQVYEAAGTMLSSRGATVTPEAVEQAVRTGRALTVSGRPAEDLPIVLDVAAERVAGEVSDRLRRAWSRDLGLLDCLLVAGGGGQALYPHLQALTPVARLLDAPAMANARGFVALAGRVGRV